STWSTSSQCWCSSAPIGAELHQHSTAFIEPGRRVTRAGGSGERVGLEERPDRFGRADLPGGRAQTVDRDRPGPRVAAALDDVEDRVTTRRAVVTAALGHLGANGGVG